MSIDDDFPQPNTIPRFADAEWAYEETRDSEYAKFFAYGYRVLVQDMDGDCSCYQITVGPRGNERIVLSRDDIGRDPGSEPYGQLYHFEAAQRMAYDGLVGLLDADYRNRVRAHLARVERAERAAEDAKRRSERELSAEAKIFLDAAEARDRAIRRSNPFGRGLRHSEKD